MSSRTDGSGVEGRVAYPARSAVLLFLACCGMFLGSFRTAGATEILPEEYRGVGITEHLGEPVDLDLAFVDHTGQAVELRDFVSDGQPILLTLNYYECPSLCTLQLNSLLEALREVDLEGEKFHVVTISIDPDETAELATQKRDAYLGQLDRSDIQWEFLVGRQAEITALAEAVGFGYRYDPDQDLFAHQAAAFFISPEGRVTRYLYGFPYQSRDVKFALMEASEGRVGSTIDRIVQLCFHYVDGSYEPFAMGIMRLGGIVVAVALGLFLLVMWRRDRRHRAEATT